MCQLTYQEEKKENETQFAIETKSPTKDHDNRCDSDNFLDPKVVADRQNKLELVLEYVSKNCTADSPHQDIRTIHAALATGGDRLVGKIISGGYTNYSYQLYLANSPITKLFSKVCFEYALWCPGDEKKYYDLDRQTCEFILMERFSKSLGTDEESSPVVTPYLLLDVANPDADEKDDCPAGNLRILVSEWASSTDEQWVNQFIDGDVDRRVLPKLATAIAKISLTKVNDPTEFNKGMLTGLREMWSEFSPLYDKFFEEEEEGETNNANDICRKYLKQHMGKEQFNFIQETMHKYENSKECLVHDDTHVFNILVEAKSDGQQSFGENGDFVLCDWEMAHTSCHGLDLGLLFYVPIACAYIHAALGSDDKAKDIISCLNEVWDVYAAYMVEEGGKDSEFLANTFMNVIGFTGMRMFCVLYALKAQIEYLNNGDLTEEEMGRVVSYVGLTGIQFQEYGFVSGRQQTQNVDLDHARGFFNSHKKAMLGTVANDDTLNRRRKMLATVTTSASLQRRRSSLLRQTGRRVSDASLNFHALSIRDLGFLDEEN